MADLPSSQLSIDALNTATPNLADLTADIAQCTYMHWRSTLQSIEHRCLEYCYTRLGRSCSRYSTMHIYLWQIDPLQLSIDALNTATPNLADIAQCTYTHGRLTPPPPWIKHRCLENQYTKYITYIYSTMHIYPLQIDPTPPPIEHRSLENHYIKYVTYIYSTMHIYPFQIDPTPLQLSIDLWKTITPNMFHT